MTPRLVATTHGRCCQALALTPCGPSTQVGDGEKGRSEGEESSDDDLDFDVFNQKWKASKRLLDQLLEEVVESSSKDLLLESSLAVNTERAAILAERATENTKLKVRGPTARFDASARAPCRSLSPSPSLSLPPSLSLSLSPSVSLLHVIRSLRLGPSFLLHSQAWQAARKSAEAALPTRLDGYTCAESYALVGTEEHLHALVGEQYTKLPPTDVFRVVDTKPKPSLVSHDANRGYVFEGAAMNGALLRLLERVRDAVKAVDRSKFEEEEGEAGFDKVMTARLTKLSSIAAAISVESSGQKPSVKSALIAYLRATGETIALDAQPGILNLNGPKVATYDRTAGELELVARDPNVHRVHRSTGVDRAWLEETLSPEMKVQYDAFEAQKLNRWLPEPEVRHYYLCATGEPLFGGDTTTIKGSLLVIGKANQAKSALLNATVAPGGWKAGGKKRVNTSDCYSYGGADPNALLGKDKTLRNAMYTLTDGTRLVKFNELESTAVWNGIKGLSNMESQSVTTKKQSSGDTFIDLVETPYAMLSCNKPPPPPPYGCEDKVAVITSDMLGAFVSDGSEDGVKSFKKMSKAELTEICLDDAVRRRMLLRCCRSGCRHSDDCSARCGPFVDECAFRLLRVVGSRRARCCAPCGLRSRRTPPRTRASPLTTRSTCPSA